ncbi:hypothetical protein M9Y10_038649 [Tritrichomonas musculus]|uniref:C2 NT-type domain-containing protein n=1 Tax=Tritrichomonas musculus TaxID=1915356 RepID=A0ABR2K9T7_9EUKA
MNNNSEFVLEFVVHTITCKNTSVRSSPLVITLPGCPDIILNAKSASVCKITYEKGKRISFTHSHLVNLKASFILVRGHGDPTIRSACSFDFFELTTANDDSVPLVYEVEIGMIKPNGSFFGMMNCTFQIMPTYEYKQALQQTSSRSSVLNTTRSYSKTQTPRKITSRQISVKAQTSTLQTPRSGNFQTQRNDIPDLSLSKNLSAKLSTRSTLNGSIHERYMKKNERWIGPHLSTVSEDQRSKRTVSVSRNSSSRSRKSILNQNDW